MTAEIVIMNQSAVAMAADSAVTIGLANGDKKIFNTANKLFALSKYHPVGIMVYNSAKIMGVEWEIIIKEYRRKLAHTKYDTLEEYSMNFYDYLNTFEIFTKEQKDKNIEFHIKAVLQMIASKVDDQVQIKMGISPTKTVSDDEVKQCINEALDSLGQIINSSPIENFSLEKFLEKYEAMIDQILATDVANIEPSNVVRIKELIYNAIGSMKYYTSYTGIVICGYGEKEIFPSMINLMINGMGDGFVIGKFLGKRSVTLNVKGAILPFAQSEMVASFMDGIDPDLYAFIQKSMNVIFDNITTIIPLAKSQVEDIHKEFDKAIIAYKRENFVLPILNIVESLPKTDLAEMAEALVNLTSFKRHVSPDAETVGGPTDVAIISKADGFIWVKRKHYFDPALNQQFFEKYNLEGC